MNILHTSDWHIGRSLYGRKRYEEFEAFLAWLVDTIAVENIDILLIAGDVFDTSAPSNRAQELYYRFLCRVAASPCRHVVVTAGNHDSASFLDAPKELLRALNVHVVGAVTERLEDEVLMLRAPSGVTELIVCAVPYLRDRDIRVAEAGESVADKELKLVDGIRTHYSKVCGLAEQKRRELQMPVPIVAMGHLFTAGGQTLEGDGVRDLYVGSLAHFSGGLFPSSIDYLALGHLHVPQKVNDSDVMRYSGSPLPMGFGEAKQTKSVCIVEFTAGQPVEITANMTPDMTPDMTFGADDSGSTGLECENLNRLFAPIVKIKQVPVFQRLMRVRGDWQEISTQLRMLSTIGSKAWLEVIYDSKEIISDLRERLDAAIGGTGMEILRVKNINVIQRVLGVNGSRSTIQDGDNQHSSEHLGEQCNDHFRETLDDLSVDQVFERCMESQEVPVIQREELMIAYQEVLTSLREEDAIAE